jgi:hypothetical protein
MLFEEVKNINENFINPAPIVRQNEASVSIENICSKFEDFLRNKGIYIAQDGWDESKIPGKLLSPSNRTNINGVNYYFEGTINESRESFVKAVRRNAKLHKKPETLVQTQIPKINIENLNLVNTKNQNYNNGKNLEILISEILKAQPSKKTNTPFFDLKGQNGKYYQVKYVDGSNKVIKFSTLRSILNENNQEGRSEIIYNYIFVKNENTVYSGNSKVTVSKLSEEFLKNLQPNEIKKIMEGYNKHVDGEELYNRIKEVSKTFLNQFIRICSQTTRGKTTLSFYSNLKEIPNFYPKDKYMSMVVPLYWKKIVEATANLS